MIACPDCGAETSATDTRSLGGYVRRRRRCVKTNCGRKVTTIEIVVADGDYRKALMGRVVILPQADVERITLLLAGALAQRIGHKPMAELLASVLPAPTNATTGDTTDGHRDPGTD